MGYYDFPHTRNYDTDLGYLITQYLNLREEVNTLLASQTITYADPLQWNITTQYAKNYIVINGYNAYLSKQPVPAGILITNTDYWLTVGDFIREFEDLRKNIASADDGVSTTATANRTKGSLVWLENTLYKVLSNINIGDAYVIDSNIQLVTVEQFIDEMVTTIDSLINNLTIKLNQETYNREKGDEDTLVAANSYTDKHTLSTNRKYIMIGDSYDSTDRGTTGWSAKAAEYLGLTTGENYFKSSAPSRGFIGDTTQAGDVTFLTLLNNLDGTISDKSSITDIVVCGGYNDLVSAINNYSGLTNAITTFISTAKSKYTNAKIWIGVCGYGFNTTFVNYSISLYGAYKTCTEHGAIYMNGMEYILHNTDLGYGDGIHPNQAGENAIGRGVAQILLGNTLHTYYSRDTKVASYVGDYTFNFTSLEERPLHISLANDIATLSCDNTITINNDKTFTLESFKNFFVEICTLESSYVFGKTNQSFTTTIPSYANIMATNERIPVSLTLGLREGKLIMIVVNETNADITGVNAIIVSRFNVVSSTLEN